MCLCVYALIQVNGGQVIVSKLWLVIIHTPIGPRGQPGHLRRPISNKITIVQANQQQEIAIVSFSLEDIRALCAVICIPHHLGAKQFQIWDRNEGNWSSCLPSFSLQNLSLTLSLYLGVEIQRLSNDFLYKTGIMEYAHCIRNCKCLA